MYLKKGVSIKGLQPEIVIAIIMVNEVSTDLVITSGTEWAPGRVPNSLHDQGLAVDIRIPEEGGYYSFQSAWKTRVQDRFKGTPYDLVWYDNHVHIEYDPK